MDAPEAPLVASVSADVLASTPAERACLAALRDVIGGKDGPMERHGVRVFLVAERLAAERGLAIDREATLCASLLHDVGAYPRACIDPARSTFADLDTAPARRRLATGVPRRPYVTDGRRFTERTLAPLGWQPGRLGRCLDAVEQHHRLRSQWARGNEVELVRRADLVDATAGLVRFELSRAWLRELFRALPRHGLYRELGWIIATMIRERPATLPWIFFPTS